MTYCLGILLPIGLVMASDSRSNAGVDQIASVRKMALFSVPGDRQICILSAGNLATTQAVVTGLRQTAGTGYLGDINSADNMFLVAEMVANKLRDVMARDAVHVQPYGDPSGTFLVGGQIGEEPPRLFQIYSAGNFIEATDRSFYLQIGETKYGKPILDRALKLDTSLEEAAKLTLLSYDATIRSNLSVDAPIDLWVHRTGQLQDSTTISLDRHAPYWTDLRSRYAEGLARLVESLPAAPLSSS
jgi:putative proteasome-type protease